MPFLQTIGFSLSFILGAASLAGAADPASPAADATPPLAVAPFDAEAAREQQLAWAKHLNQPVEFTSPTTGLKLKLIPPGAIRMGSAANYWEMPVHLVKISKPFYLGETHVTRGQFRRFVEDAHYKTEAESDGKGGYGYGANTGYNWLKTGLQQTDDHPVVIVTWNDAVAFCKWLSKKDGKDYRLPTEAQWEFACRAGSELSYSFGDGDRELGDYAWYDKNSGKTSHPVGEKKANGFGLYDMHGGAWQWCADRYRQDYSHGNGPADDPEDLSGRLARVARVVRGGSWNNSAGDCQSASRTDRGPRQRYDDLGFRVVLAAGK
jgi:eukaryotic-like serine/threonine-protein kinase